MRAKKYKLFLVRHAQSVANADRTVYWHSKVYDHVYPLTPLGTEQAEACGALLHKAIGAAKVSAFVSPYARAQQTWAGIAKSFKPKQIAEVVNEGRLREQEFKHFRTLEEYEQKKLRAEQRGRLYYRYKNAESGYDVLNRVGNFYNQLRMDWLLGNRQPTVVVVAHEIVIRCFLMLLLDLHPNNYKMYIDNCEVTELEAGANLKFSVRRAADFVTEMLKARELKQPQDPGIERQ